jgi:ADP-ribose pyrophosphatase YjhB (NUDIX family)
MATSSSEILRYAGQYIQIKEQTIGTNVWEKAFFKSGVVVYPFTNDGKLILVEELRPHEIPNARVKPVTGIIEDEYTIEENALKELREEIGLGAKTVKQFLHLSSTGTINSHQYFVLATGLYPDKIPNPDGEETIQKTITTTLDDCIESYLKGELTLGQSAVGLFKLQYLLKNGLLRL